MPLTQEATDYFDTSPMSADALALGPQAFWKRIEETRALPENLRRALIAEETSVWIRDTVVKRHRLQPEDARALADALGRVLRGEEGAANFAGLVQRRISAPPAALQEIVRSVTERFITPNYFQINQVYEKKHKAQAVGMRYEAVGTADEATRTPEPPAPSRAALAPPARPASPNVVDLRNGAIPSRLPPSPPRVAPAPAGAEWGPPLAPTGPKTPPSLRPGTPTTPGLAAPAFLPTPKPPVPALPTSVKPSTPEPENNSMPPPASPPVPRIQGTPLDHITPSDRPLAQRSPPRSATTRNSSLPPITPLPPPASR